MGKISEIFNFENIGRKIKNLSKWSCWITILLIWIAAPIVFFVLVSDLPELCWIPIVSAIIGPIFIWVGSWAMYAFGEFVEDIHAMRSKEWPAGKSKHSTQSGQSTLTGGGDATPPSSPTLSRDDYARMEQARLDGIYKKAQSAMSAANTEYAYKEAARLFKSISEYMDSAALAQSCLERAETARKDAVLGTGKAKMTGDLIPNYEKAIQLFRSISGWRDADEMIPVCQKKIEELKAKAEAERLERERLAEIARQEAERRAKRNRKIALITTPIVCVILVFVIVLNTVIIPNKKHKDAVALMDGKYNDAIALMDAGNVVEAYEALLALDGYKDSADKANSICDKYMIEKLKSAKVGDYVFFGSYEQDNNTSNGQEYIEWLVLEVKDGKALVISKYALDYKSYATSFPITWETCSLRQWLNDDFVNTAFTAEEKAMIPTVTVSADTNPEYSTNPGEATQDQVFLLSITEVNKYFTSDSARMCQVAYDNPKSGDGNCWWWLRSPGMTSSMVAGVFGDGTVYKSGRRSDTINAVRPALWIDPNA